MVVPDLHWYSHGPRKWGCEKEQNPCLVTNIRIWLNLRNLRTRLGRKNTSIYPVQKFNSLSLQDTRLESDIRFWWGGGLWKGGWLGWEMPIKTVSPAQRQWIHSWVSPCPRHLHLASRILLPAAKKNSLLFWYFTKTRTQKPCLAEHNVYFKPPISKGLRTGWRHRRN